MEFLKAEIASKRKALQEDPTTDGRPSKYMRRGELERLREEKERQLQEAKLQQESSKKASKSTRDGSKEIQVRTNLILLS